MEWQGEKFYFLTRITYIYEIVCFLNEKIQTHEFISYFELKMKALMKSIGVKSHLC